MQLIKASTASISGSITKIKTNLVNSSIATRNKAANALQAAANKIRVESEQGESERGENQAE